MYTLCFLFAEKKVYELDNYKCVMSLDGHIGAVYTLAVMGNRFFSGSYDSTIKVI